jgi:hypothetical protein
VCVIRDIVELADDRASAEAYMRGANRTWSVFLGVGDFSTNEMDIVGYVTVRNRVVTAVSINIFSNCSCSHHRPYHRPYHHSSMILRSQVDRIVWCSFILPSLSPSSRHRYRHDDLHVYTPETMPAITLQPEFENLVYVDKHPQVGGGDSTLSRTSSPTQPRTMPTIHRTSGSSSALAG